MGLTGFVIIHVFIASFSPAQGERNQMVNTKFTRPVNEISESSSTNVPYERTTKESTGIRKTCRQGKCVKLGEFTIGFTQLRHEPLVCSYVCCRPRLCTEDIKGRDSHPPPHRMSNKQQQKRQKAGLPHCSERMACRDILLFSLQVSAMPEIA